ncbi:MAG: preprotein translocase subunit SecG [bacterium]|nr:preprotein translocase subunit SecG [Candidatus Sumerlaeota bacterium]
MAIVGFYIFLILYFLVCLFLVLVIMSQEGKGGGLSGMAGASALGETFGFGSAPAAIRRWTRNGAIVFFIMTVILTFWGERFSSNFTRKFLAGANEAPMPAAAGAQQQQPNKPQAPGRQMPQQSSPGLPARAEPVPIQIQPVESAPPAAPVAPATVVPVPSPAATPVATPAPAAPPVAATPAPIVK